MLLFDSVTNLRSNSDFARKERNFMSYRLITQNERKRFKKWLIDKDMSMREFARQNNISVVYISNLMNGKEHLTDKAKLIFLQAGFNLK